MMNRSTVKIEWRLLSRLTELESIETQWQMLYGKLEKDSPFLCPQWVFKWIEIYWNKNWKLYALVGFVNKDIVAFVPTYMQHYGSFLNIKKMYPLGQGEPEDVELSTEYLDILIDPEWKSISAPYIKDWIKNSPADVFYWNAALSKSNLIEIIDGIPNYERNYSARFVIDSDAWDVSNLSVNTKKRYSKSRNKLKKSNVKISWISREEFELYWPLMINLHQERWQDQGKKGAFIGTEFRVFHENMLNSDGTVFPMLSMLTIGGAPAAIHYYLAIEDTLHFYQSGWDSRSFSKYSPGLVLHIWSIQNSPFRFYDLMMGESEGSYKSKFGCIEEDMLSISIVNSPVKIFLEKIIVKIEKKYDLIFNKGMKKLL